MRGPGVAPRVPGRSAVPTARMRFDALVLGAVAELEERWGKYLGLVEYAVEEAPLLPRDWDSPVPLAALVPERGDTPTRLVVFRQPIEARAGDRRDVEALVLTVLVEQFAEMLGIDPTKVDPRYSDD